MAAKTPELADEAARLVAVEYERCRRPIGSRRWRPALLVYAGPVNQGGTAGGGGAAKGLEQKGNPGGPNEQTRGDVTAGLAAAAVKVGGTFRTQVQTHSAMETAAWSPTGRRTG